MYVPYPSPQPIYYGSRYGGCFKLFLYAVSFFIPLVGLIIGLVFMSRPDPESRGLGRACLIVSIISFIMTCCTALLTFALPEFFTQFIESQGF